MFRRRPVFEEVRSRTHRGIGTTVVCGVGDFRVRLSLPEASPVWVRSDTSRTSFPSGSVRRRTRRATGRVAGAATEAGASRRPSPRRGRDSAGSRETVETDGARTVSVVSSPPYSGPSTVSSLSFHGRVRTTGLGSGSIGGLGTRRN